MLCRDKTVDVCLEDKIILKREFKEISWEDIHKATIHLKPYKSGYL